eukprot:GHVP01056535.1.p1 GENE.GHVP01056535.1~~GHVP01056535.1.p1  ORF type:complete len:394 (-),score=116.04 GHVP01056535.1:299-1480(-)
MSVCRSSAWDSKIFVGCYWVYANQVSKTAPTGEYLSTGGFMIRGKRNYLPASDLEMGFTVLFCLGEDSVNQRRLENKEIVEEEIIDAKFVDKIKSYADSKPQDKSAEKVKESLDSKCTPMDIEDYLKEEISDHESSEKVQIDASKIEFEDPFERHERKDELRGKKHLSKTERKTMKGIKPEVPSNEPKAKPPVPKQEASKLNKRQQRKLKKAAEKYGEQDPEERAISLALLGAKPLVGLEVKELEMSESEGEVVEVEDSVNLEEFGVPKDVETVHFDDEQDIDALLEEAPSLLEQLVFSPKENETVLFAIPMCAPYSAILKSKHKAKLAPGGGKKGGAAESAVRFFLQHETNENLKKCLENLTLAEVTQVLVSSPKIVSLGGERIKPNKYKKK